MAAWRTPLLYFLAVEGFTPADVFKFMGMAFVWVCGVAPPESMLLSLTSITKLTKQAGQFYYEQKMKELRDSPFNLSYGGDASHKKGHSKEDTHIYSMVEREQRATTAGAPLTQFEPKGQLLGSRVSVGGGNNKPKAPAAAEDTVTLLEDAGIPPTKMVNGTFDNCLAALNQGGFLQEAVFEALMNRDAVQAMEFVDGDTLEALRAKYANHEVLQGQRHRGYPPGAPEPMEDEEKKTTETDCESGSGEDDDVNLLHAEQNDSDQEEDVDSEEE
jgi:hypothetical protein